MLACGEGAAVRRLSAAKLYGFSRFPAPWIEVVSPRRRKVCGTRVHHCRSLDPRDVTDLDGIPITTVHRTAAGYTVLRFRDRDVHQHPGEVTARTAAALASSPVLRRAA